MPVNSLTLELNSMPITAPPFKDIDMSKFPTSFRSLLAKKGLSQSDVARSVWGIRIDRYGNTLVKNREIISSYCRGTARPTARKLREIVKALGMTEQEFVNTLNRDNTVPPVKVSPLQIIPEPQPVKPPEKTFAWEFKTPNGQSVTVDDFDHGPSMLKASIKITQETARAIFKLICDDKLYR